MALSPEWPRSPSSGDVQLFPAVASKGDFVIRVDYADPFGDLANKVLERLKRPDRYVCVFQEDEIVHEGLWTLPEAISAADECARFTEGRETRPTPVDSEQTLLRILDSLKPSMTPEEKKHFLSIRLEYENLKRNYAAENN